MTVRVAFPLIGRGGWTGGYNYLKNTLDLIRTRLADEIEAYVFLSPEENEQYGSELFPLVEGRIVVNPSIGTLGRGVSLVKTLVSGREKAFEKLLLEAKIDVAFENANYYGNRIAVPVISWIPDFQHQHMPEMFSRLGWWRREIGFRVQIGAGRTIMLSSKTAQDDLERFYGDVKGGAHVVRFAIDLDQAPYLDQGARLRETYNLPHRYFYLPNQFWRHKNHAVIIEALGHIQEMGNLEKLPPVILTGNNKDPRNPGHFDALMQLAKDKGVESHFRYLGMVAYRDVLALNANCDALINPSTFEGWSTPIEEAKAFATPMILADIPIHREQAPKASFFDWHSPHSAAEALLSFIAKPSISQPSLATLRVEQSKRLDAHAAALLETIQAAACCRSSSLHLAQMQSNEET